MRSASNQLDLFADYAPPVPVAEAEPAPAAILPFPLARTRHVATLARKLAAMTADASRVKFYQRSLADLIRQRQRCGLSYDVAVADVEKLHRLVKFIIEAPPTCRTARRDAPAAPVIPLRAAAAQ